MLLFRGDLPADSGAIAEIDQVAERSLDKRHARQLVNRPCGAQRHQPRQWNDRGVEISARNIDERNNESGNPGDGAVVVRTDG